MKNKNQCFFNGKILPLSEAKFSVLDRGFLYGDGVFESFRTYHKIPFSLDEHIKRLIQGARLIHLKPIPSARQIKFAVLKTLRVNNFPDSYIKIILTRGLAKGHGLSMRNASGNLTFLVLVEKLKDYPGETYTRGWKAIISSIQKPDLPTSRIKSLNYLNSVLAMQEAQRAGAQEAFMLDRRGHAVEGLISNFFIVKNSTLYTPPKDAPILLGITRSLAIKIARQSAFPIVEKNISPKEIYTADECFVTFSGAGIVPITRIWNKKIGSGKCGAVTASLIRLYNDQTQKL